MCSYTTVVTFKNFKIYFNNYHWKLSYVQVSELCDHHGLEKWFSKCDLQTSSIRITWQLVRNAKYGALPQSSGGRAEQPVETSSSLHRDYNASQSLRTTGLENCLQ